ncbi:GlxA family transcriptional regulator [Skermanella stibiiresistens]|nr:GlxA family transcriptional regulator [Skermanella stibiiresistens]
MSKIDRPLMAVLAYPDVQILDVTGPLQVFCHAGYPVEIIGLERGPIRTSSGMRIIAERGIGEVSDGIDTLLVAGGVGVDRPAADPHVHQWLHAMRPRARRLGSVCSGAFVLAAAGLLDGRRAVTHWARCDEFRAAFPKVLLEPDALHIRDGGIHTSAGVTAGMDLALAMVEEDQGHRAALDIARQLVLFLKRPGGQSQFSSHVMAEADASSPIRSARDWIVGNPGADLRVEELAARAAMSPRNFARVFQRETGDTPQKFVEKVRLDAARARLERTREPVERIALATGFGTAETMRRTFLRRLGVTPQDYRNHFRAEMPVPAL